MPVEAASGESAAPEAPRTGPGELLRNRRKERGLSLEQVADDLHLDQHIIEALEAERFTDIGVPVFVRGHLKAYARTLRMDEAPVLDAYQAVQPEDQQEPVLTRRAPERRVTITPGPWAMGAVGLLLVVALAVYVMWDEPAEPVSEAPPPPRPPAAARLLPPPEPAELPEPVAEAPAAIPAPGPATGAGSDAVPDVPGAEPVASEPVAAAVPAPARAATEPEPAAEPESAAPAVASGIELEFYFREESWVEISDPDRRILFGLQREGMRRQLTGEPPIQVLLGNAPGVDVYLNKQLYAVPARNINGKVARFIIDPSAASNP